MIELIALLPIKPSFTQVEGQAREAGHDLPAGKFPHRSLGLPNCNTPLELNTEESQKAMEEACTICEAQRAGSKECAVQWARVEEFQAEAS